MQKKSIVYAVSSVIILVVIASFIIFTNPFSFFQQSAYGKDIFPKDTSVVGVSLEGKSNEEAKIELQTKIMDWQSKQQLYLSFEGEDVVLPSTMFEFDIEATLNQLKRNLDVPGIVVKVKNDVLIDTLTAFGDGTFYTHIDVQKLSQAIEMQASNLHIGKTNIYVQQFVKVEGVEEVVSSATTSIPAKYEKVVSYWIHKYSEVEIDKNTTFSFLKQLMGTENEYSDEEWSFISSAMMKVVLPTNFEIIERHTGRNLPHYTKLGNEAKIVKEELDFSFMNHNNTAYRIESSVNKDGLTMKVIGQPFIYTYKHIVKNKETYEPKVEKKQIASLPVGSMNVKKQGQKGLSGKVMRQKYTKLGHLVKEVQLFDDFYPPTSMIVEEGTAPMEVETPTSNQEALQHMLVTLQRELEKLQEEKGKSIVRNEEQVETKQNEQQKQNSNTEVLKTPSSSNYQQKNKQIDSNSKHEPELEKGDKQSTDKDSKSGIDGTVVGKVPLADNSEMPMENIEDLRGSKE
jgi:VanW like protein/G5 domain